MAKLTFDDKIFVLTNWREDAESINDNNKRLNGNSNNT